MSELLRLRKDKLTLNPLKHEFIHTSFLLAPLQKNYAAQLPIKESKSLRLLDK